MIRSNMAVESSPETLKPCLQYRNTLSIAMEVMSQQCEKICYIPYGQSLRDLPLCFDRLCDFHVIIQASITIDI